MQSNLIDECTASFGCYYIDDVAIPYSVTPKIPNNCYAVSRMTLLSVELPRHLQIQYFLILHVLLYLQEIVFGQKYDVGHEERQPAL